MDLDLKVDYEIETGAPFTDNLTGLFNYGFFQMSLDREVHRAERHGEEFTLALINVDSFTRYNRRHGSMKGDRVLKEIAGVIMENIRQEDLAAKYTGDVFGVILSKSDAESAFVPVERIRQAVEEMSGGDPTISAGLASYPGDAKDGEGLINKAQNALSKAKVRGKNRVHFFEKEIISKAGAKPKVLVVDDEPRNLKLMEAMLFPLNYEVIKASGGEDALSIVSKFDLDLILLDIMMPGMDGYEVCRRLKGNESTRLIPVVLVTALDDTESKVKGIEAGADDFITKPPNKIELLARTKSLINIKRLNNSLTSIEDVLFALANAVEAKDKYTQGHTERVSNLAVLLGKRMSIDKNGLASLRTGGILHDIGKIGIPEEILNKPGRLTPEEREVMERHPGIGHGICLPLERNLKATIDMVRHHHEKLDGSGYPDGLKGDEISRSARIMAVVDIYDSLVTDRPYRKGMAKEKAFSILNEEAGEGKLDKEIVGYLMEILGNVSGETRVNKEVTGT